MGRLIVSDSKGNNYEITLYGTPEEAGENHFKIGKEEFVALGNQNHANATPMYIIQKGEIKKFILTQSELGVSLPTGWRWAETGDFVSPDKFNQMIMIEGRSLKKLGSNEYVALIDSDNNVTSINFKYNKLKENIGFYIFAEDDLYVYGASLKVISESMKGIKIRKAPSNEAAVFTSSSWGVKSIQNAIPGAYVNLAIKWGDIFIAGTSTDGLNYESSFQTLATIRNEINSPNAKIALGYINWSPSIMGTIDSVKLK